MTTPACQRADRRTDVSGALFPGGCLFGGLECRTTHVCKLKDEAAETIRVVVVVVVSLLSGDLLLVPANEGDVTA